MTPAEMFFCGQSGFSTVGFSLWPSKYPGSTETGVGVDANQHALKMTLLQLVIISLISALYSNQFHCTRHKDPQKSGRSAASRHEGSIWSNSLSKYMYKSMIELKIKKTRTHISWRQFYSVFYFYFLSLSAEAAEQQRTDHWDGVRRVKLSHSVHSFQLSVRLNSSCLRVSDMQNNIHTRCSVKTIFLSAHSWVFFGHYNILSSSSPYKHHFSFTPCCLHFPTFLYLSVRNAV